MKKIAILLFVIVSTPVVSQTGVFGTSDARSLGMGNSGAASSYGLYSIGKNPALMIETRKTTDTAERGGFFLMQIPGFSANLATNAMSIDDINYYFGNDEFNRRYLTDADKENLKKLFEGDGRIAAGAHITLLSAVYRPSADAGAFGFSVQDDIHNRFVVPEVLVELLMDGNEPGREYSFNEFSVQSQWTRSIAFSYANEILKFENFFIESLSGGITLKYVQGFSYTNMNMLYSSVQTGDMNALSGGFLMLAETGYAEEMSMHSTFNSSFDDEFSYSVFPGSSGSGLGFDFGLSADFDFGLTLGFAITDMGRVNWTENVQEHRIYGDFYIDDILDDDQLDSLEHMVKRSSAPANRYLTELPQALRVGVAYDLTKAVPGTMTLALDYIQAMNDHPANLDKSRIAFGAEWAPGAALPIILTGLTFDSEDNVNIALGAGYSLGVVDLFLSAGNVPGAIDMNGSTNFSFAFDSNWRLF